MNKNDDNQIRNPLVFELIDKYYSSKPKFSLVDERKARKQGMNEHKALYEKRVLREKEMQEDFKQQIKIHATRRNIELNLLKRQFDYFISAKMEQQRKRIVYNKLRWFDLLKESNFLIRHKVINHFQLKNSKVFPADAFQRNNSRQFLNAVRAGLERKVKDMIEEDPLLVFQFDDWKQTPLILAAKTNNTQMAVILLKAFARVNFRDIQGRTALMYAIKNNNMELTRYLFCFRANPFFCVGGMHQAKHALDICTDWDISVIIKKAQSFRLSLHVISNVSKKNDFWNKEARLYFDPDNELRLPQYFQFY